LERLRESFYTSGRQILSGEMGRRQGNASLLLDAAKELGIFSECEEKAEVREASLPVEAGASQVVAYRYSRTIVRAPLKGFKDLGERSQGNAAEEHGRGF
jgi:hypothetical protein